ncbi:MAG: hypothetical protein AAGA03_02265 [Planctomycetota bacterium]
MNPHAAFALNVVSTWYMVGLIWMVQIVHYNLFDRVGAEEFIRYESDHARLITPLVGLPMLIEITTAALLCLFAPPEFPRWAALSGFALVLAIWLSTALIQVPCHSELSKGFDPDVYRRLVNSNWIRTVAWSLRGILVGFFGWRMIEAG